MKTKTVGIRMLKNRLSAYVRAIEKGGSEVVITDRGRAVARLVGLGVPAAPGRQPMRIRPAVKDHSDLSWMRKPSVGRSKLRVKDLTAALEFIRADKEFK